MPSGRLRPEQGASPNAVDRVARPPSRNAGHGRAHCSSSLAASTIAVPIRSASTTEIVRSRSPSVSTAKPSARPSSVLLRNRNASEPELRSWKEMDSCGLTRTRLYGLRRYGVRSPPAGLGAAGHVHPASARTSRMEESRNASRRDARARRHRHRTPDRRDTSLGSGYLLHAPDSAYR
jgi:hypothetical protein